MIVLDASLLIAYRNKADPHHADAMALLLAHADDDFAMSALTLIEADKMITVAREQGYEAPT